jgi:hypothetical protein
MTRDVAAAAVVVTLVGWAFYATLGGHAEPKPGAAGVHNLMGMTNPHVTPHNIRSTKCRRGWDASLRTSSAQTSEIKRSLLHGRRAYVHCTRSTNAVSRLTSEPLSTFDTH